ncbi:MAG TPA: cupin domain-containing protein [Trebonia sp.]|nr:cupin domain-containing protein [Trebonia sp.]HVW20419.1 cupin domain-containing protein [Opitutaceae bacterium]
MKIDPAGTQPSRRAPAEWFDGTVWLDEIAGGAAPSHIYALRVTFEPGARTIWHSHPFGQTLHVLSGLGRVQKAGGPVNDIRPGDTVWIAPGEKHWHGASARQGMVHLAIQQGTAKDTATEWHERVSDAEYAG